MDVGYWETLSQFVAAQMARTRLRERHQEHLRRKLAYLQQNQGITTSSSEQNPIFPSGSSANSNQLMIERIRELQQKQAATAEKLYSGDEEERVTDTFKEPLAPLDEPTPVSSTSQPEAPTVSSEPDPYDSALYSPKLLTQADVEIDAVLYDAQDDWAKLEYQRKDVMHTGTLRKSAEEELMKRAREGVEEGDAEFSVLVSLCVHFIYL